MDMDTLYYLMVASFLTHQLDAVKRRDIRIIPGLSMPSDPWQNRFLFGFTFPCLRYRCLAETVTPRAPFA